MTKEQALKLRNGQHIKVKFSKYGHYRDALFVKYEPRWGIYAHYMGIDRITKTASSIYGINDYFDLDEVKIPNWRNQVCQ